MSKRTDDEQPPASDRPVTAEQLILWSSVIVVVAVAVGAAVVSYRHARELVLGHGETGLTALIAPATVDGLIYACSMVILSAARSGQRRGFWELVCAQWLAYLGLALGIAATVGANIAHGAGHGPIGAIVAAWPAVALVISYEVLMLIVRASRPAPGEELGAPEPCQCGEGGGQVAPVALTLPDAVALAVELAGSQRQLAEALGADRKKISAALRQARAGDEHVAQINGVEILEPA